jgi:TPR repeat protein
MLAEGLRFAFLWRKPLSSPDRRTKVQGFVEAGPRTRIGLVFTDRQGTQLQRSLLSEMSTGSFDLKYIFGDITWLDDRTVKVTQDNGRDYWLCTSDGGVEFHYPRAESGAADGEFALGRMYFEGTVVLQDRERGLSLIRSAAAKGDKHALALLRRVEEASSAAGSNVE